MAKKSPEMQLFLLQQAANAAKEAERAERIALAKRKMDLEEEKVRLRAARIAALSADTERKAAKKPVRKLTVAEKEDARIALLTQEFIAANPHLAPMPTPATPPNTLNPDDRDLAARTEQIVASQEQRAMEIEAARKAYREREHEEWLAAQPAEPEEPAP